MGARASWFLSGFRGLQRALLLCGELAWLYAWSSGLAACLGGREPLLGIAALLALLVLAAMATRLAIGRARPLTRGALGLLGLISATLAAVGPLAAFAGLSRSTEVWHQLLGARSGLSVLVGMGLALVAWWRGISLGRATPTLHTAETSFRTGIFALSGLLVLMVLAGQASAPVASSLVLPTLVVIAAGLVAMPFARIVDVSAQRRGQERQAPAPSGPWLAMLLGVVVALLLATLALAHVFTFERIGMALRPLRAVLWVLLLVVALPTALLMEWLIHLARLLLPDLTFELRLAQMPRQGLLEGLQQQGEIAADARLVLGLQVLVGLALACVVIFALARAVVRLRQEPEEDDVEETRDLVWRWPGLAAIWRWLLCWLRPRRRQPVSTPMAPPASVGVADSVRELYRQFLALGAAIGRARRATETPLEYEGRLHGEASLPGGDEIGSITETYVQVRYGPPDWASPGVEAVASALTRLCALWQGWLLAAGARGRRSDIAVERPAPGRADAGDDG